MGMTDEDRRALKGGRVQIEPMALPIPDAVAFSGYSRARIYRLLAAGELDAVKIGGRTLIKTDSIKAHVASLPPATFGSRQAAA